LAESGSNNQGFTIVEVVVAASLFLTALVAFSFLLSVGGKSVQSSSRLGEALFTIRAKAEAIRATPFSQLEALNGSTFAAGQGKVFILPALSDLYSIRLEFAWDKNKTPLNIYTLRSSY
jgi:Tfp pilus assembly protein PilV